MDGIHWLSSSKSLSCRVNCFELAFLEAILMELYFFCVAYQQVGDLIETYLVQIRDIDKVMKSAKTGSVKERRNAAFELASLAATGDDTKFRIVQEGG